MTRPTSETHSFVTGGAVVSAAWDEYGRLHVRVDIDGIPDSRLIDGSVPLDISVGDAQLFPPTSDDEAGTTNSDRVPSSRVSASVAA